MRARLWPSSYLRMGGCEAAGAVRRITKGGKVGCAAWVSARGMGGGASDCVPLGRGALRYQQRASGSVKGSGPQGEGREPSRKEESSKRKPGGFSTMGKRCLHSKLPDCLSAALDRACLASLCPAVPLPFIWSVQQRPLPVPRLWLPSLPLLAAPSALLLLKAAALS